MMNCYHIGMLHVIHHTLKNRLSKIFNRETGKTVMLDLNDGFAMEIMEEF